MKTLSFDYDEQDNLVINCDNAGLVSALENIIGMFDKKSFLADMGWVNTSINGVRRWYYSENRKEALEVMVSIHDFFYYQSDNIDKFLRGDAYLRKLNRQLEEELSPSEAVVLWNKYAPKELQKQLPE